MLQKFADNFSEAVRQSGSVLFTSGRVSPLFGSDELFKAEVLDTALYTVGLKLQDRRLHVCCDCDEFSAGQLCSHIWASLQAAQQQEALGKCLRRNIGKDIILGSGATDSASAEPVYEHLILPKKTRSESPIPPPAPAALPPLHFLPPAATHKSDATLLYVIDIADKVSDSRSLCLELWWRHLDSRGRAVCRALDAQLETHYVAETELPLLRFLQKKGARHPELKHACLIAQTHLDDLLLLLAGKENLRYYHSKTKPFSFKRLSYVPSIKFMPVLDLVERPSQCYRIEAYIVTAIGEMPVEQLDYFSMAGLAIYGQHILQLELSFKPELILRVWQGKEQLFTRTEALQLAAEFKAGGQACSLRLPNSLKLSATELKPTGRLYVQTAEYKFGGREQLQAELSFDYAGTRVLPNEQSLLLSGVNADTLLQRDLAAEEALILRLQSLDFKRMSADNLLWRLLPSRLDLAVRSLVMEDWHVSAAGKTYRKPKEKKAVVQGAGMDWLEIEAAVQFDGQNVALPILLQAMRNGQKSVRLDDGTYGLLPQEWLENFTALTEIGVVQGEKVRIRLQQAALVAALLQERLQDNDGKFTAALQTWQQIRPLPPELPVGFKAQLRPYQADGLAWLQQMCRAGIGVCLADDMGLGKTVQVLALLAWRKQQNPGRPSLLLLPRSLVFNWWAEAERFAPDLRLGLYLGTQRNRLLRQLHKYDVILSTYGTLRHNPLPLAKHYFDYCILDEAQAIKNADAATAKAVRSLNAEYRLCITGTPIENNLSEFFSQLEFLNPGMLGKRFIKFFQRNQFSLGRSQLSDLQRAVRPFLLRRSKEAVAKDLPPKSVQLLYCELDSEQRAYYDELKEYYQRQLQEKPSSGGGSNFQALTALLRLRQAACHPGLLNDKFRDRVSAKQKFLLGRLQELARSGKKALVFSQFTGFLKLLKPGLEQLGLKYCYLDGASRDRSELVRQFQQDENISLFLISLKAGGVGLNLTAAEYVFIIDPWWNPAVEAQAIDRAYRIGQKNAVFAYKLIARGTVEEKMLLLQQSKSRLAEKLLDGAVQKGFTLQADDFKMLLE
ncbi:MAG: DEAD/DEAH box helicase [Oligosphaeraceae bacterium]|nr:DEAD/DEAH box helicase [Oligosphaeraceae bacterium]